MTTIYLDISPLMEFNWTGIAVVTRGLAMELLRQRSDDAVFFFSEIELFRPKLWLDHFDRQAATC